MMPLWSESGGIYKKSALEREEESTARRMQRGFPAPVPDQNRSKSRQLRYQCINQRYWAEGSGVVIELPYFQNTVAAGACIYVLS